MRTAPRGATSPASFAARFVAAADRAAVEQLLTDAHLPTAGVPEILAGRAADFLVAEVPGGSGALAGAATS